MGWTLNAGPYCFVPEMYVAELADTRMDNDRAHQGDNVALERIRHIARHSISIDEFEEVCFGNSLVLRTKSRGENPVYSVLGRTASGRHLLCIVIQFPNAVGYPVTARPMDDAERRRFRRWEKS